MENPYASPSANLGGQESFAADNGGVTQGVVNQLARTKGWTRFIGVLVIIMGVIIMLAAIMGGAFLGQLTGSFGIPSQAGGFVAGIVAVYFVIGGLYLVVGIKLNSFSSTVARLIYSGRQSDLEDALDRQRSFWLLVGILSIILIIASLIGLLAGVMSGVD